MRRREKPVSPSEPSWVPPELAAGPLVEVWVDRERLAAHRRGEDEYFDPGVSARRRWMQARAAWVAAQPDREAAQEALRARRSLDVG